MTDWFFIVKMNTSISFAPIIRLEGAFIKISMNKILGVLIAFAVTIGQADATTAPEKPLKIRHATQIVSADFGLFELDTPQGPRFSPGTVVPLVENQAYGWIIRLRTDKPTVKWREEFVLPERPATWGDPEPLGKRSISSSGRTSITEREVTPEKGVISNVWTVAPGDPKGRHLIRVFVEGVLVKTFLFEVQ